MTDSETRRRGALAFERETIVIALSRISPLKVLRSGTRESNKYRQILTSVRAIGIIESPAVIPAPNRPGRYALFKSNLRVEALKALGIAEVECLVATVDETYTYNKQINRIPPIQQHRMLLRAIDRGVTEERIAEALGVNVQTIQRRTRLLDDICADAAEILKDAPCPAASFNVLRRMAPMRQVEAAELMIGQNNFTTVFTKAILAATPEVMIVDPRKKKRTGDHAVTSDQLARMERELTSLQAQVKSVEETYGIDNLHLTVARGYIRKLLDNARVVRWLTQHRQEYLAEFQSVAEIESLVPVSSAAE